jgi:hypothetical protein
MKHREKDPVSKITCSGCGGVPIESLMLYVTRLSELSAT